MSDAKTSTASKAIDGISAAFNVIPSVYYDLIARLCPGLVFCLAVSVLPACRTGGAWSANCLAKVGEVNWPVVIVLSYAVGMVATGFGILRDWLTARLLSLPKDVRKAIGLRRNEPIAVQWREVAEKMEAISKKDVEAGRAVAKALAEVSLCENLLTCLIAAILIGWASDGALFVDVLEGWHAIYMLASLLLALFLAVLFRQAMFFGRVQAIYVMYVNPRKEKRKKCVVAKSCLSVTDDVQREL